MHVLVPVDESEPSENAFDYAVRNFPDADLTLLHVVDPPEEISFAPDISGSISQTVKNRKEEAKSMFAEFEPVAAEHGVEFETDVAVGKVSRKVLEYAEENDVDGIVIGSHGRTGLSRVRLGSVAENVVRRSPIPVTVVR